MAGLLGSHLKDTRSLERRYKTELDRISGSASHRWCQWQPGEFNFTEIFVKMISRKYPVASSPGTPAWTPELSLPFELLTSVHSDKFSQQTGHCHKTFCRTYISPFRHIYPTNWAYRTYISPFTNIYPTKWAWITLSDNIDEIIISKGIESKPGFLFIAKWFEKMIICGREPGLIKMRNEWSLADLQVLIKMIWELDKRLHV